MPVFYPTMEDMNKPFEDFIEKHERKIGTIGLAKIVPPPGWSPRPQGTPGYEQDPDITIERCIKQVGSRGLVGEPEEAHISTCIHGPSCMGLGGLVWVERYWVDGLSTDRWVSGFGVWV